MANDNLCEMVQSTFKALYDSGHHQMLWQWIPEPNYDLSNEVLADLSSSSMERGETGLTA